jgi:hypothetical protein
MIDRSKLKRLLRERLPDQITGSQIDRLADRLIEIERPTEQDIEDISREITGSRLIVESIDIDDIITILDQAAN